MAEKLIGSRKTPGAVVKQLIEPLHKIAKAGDARSTERAAALLNLKREMEPQIDADKRRLLES